MTFLHVEYGARPMTRSRPTPLPRCRLSILMAATMVFAVTAASNAQTAPPNGATIFERSCASCHRAGGQSTAPAIDGLRVLAPEAIVTALTTGRMRVQGESLTIAERRNVAEWLSGRAVTASTGADADRCAVTPPLPATLDGPAWNGWSPTASNARFQPTAVARLSASDVPKLRLRWAFGFAGSLAARTQPSIVAGRLFTASERGDVYALDARTGCRHWTFTADAAVRTAITVVPFREPGSATRYAAYFGDGRANAYAVDADNGRLLWRRKIDDHPNAAITGAIAAFEEQVFAVTSAAGEEVRGGRPDYGCCTFRGSVTALDATTGAVAWKAFSIPTAPAPRGRNTQGVTLFGPAGGGIWGTPTIDARRRVLYVGTGNGFAEPVQPTTNAILALDLATGRIRWSRQTVPDDIWLWQCPETTAPNQNCPPRQGPDFDFGTGPLVARTSTGRDLLIVPQKSGVLHALDPDADGAIVWQYRFGEGSSLGGQWGAAADDRLVYVGVGGSLSETPGGVHAVRIDDGQRAWAAPPRPALCAGGADERCFAAQGGALTVIPGVVLSGGADGGVRAYAAADGTLLWEVDTNRPFETVNGVRANGAAIDGAGPVVVDGMLYINSGYNGIVGRAGNVLLAFGID